MPQACSTAGVPRCRKGDAEFNADPVNPASIPGRAFPGAKDARDFEKQPEVRSMLLMDYVRRVRYREGYDKEVFLQPGQVVPVRFDIGWTSIVFNQRHRIRVTVSSTGASFYEPNRNTGEPLTIDPPARTQMAHNRLHVSGSHASRIIAPLVNRDATPRN